jgi:hypothetical protein
MLSSAATFSFFLSVGSVRGHILNSFYMLPSLTCTLCNHQVIRQDALIPPQLEAAHIQMLAASPLVRSRQDGAMLMRARWEAEKQRRAVPA